LEIIKDANDIPTIDNKKHQTLIMNTEQKTNESTIKIYIDGKEILYSHQNIVAAINSFLPYLTNDDLDEMMKTFATLKDHRRQKEYLAHLEASQKSIQSNRHDT
jgi:hypothetical protein